MGGSQYVLDARPDLGGLAVALAVVGLLRGIAEGYWYYLMTGTQGQLPYLLTQELWYTKYGGPFLLLNIPSAHFLWFTTAIILHLTGLALGGRGSYRAVLQITGVALFSYLGIGLINYLHLVWSLPSVTFHASPFFHPNLGIGQLIVFGWLIMVCYGTLIRVHRLDRLSAALGSALPILLSLVFYLVSAAMIFRVLMWFPEQIHPADWLSIANATYLIATAGLTGGMVVGTRNWQKIDPD